MTKRPNITALIVAAGSGQRMGGELPKQYQPMAGRPMLRRTIEAFLNHPAITEVRVVISPDHRVFYDEAVKGLTLGAPIHGGTQRQDSVRLGLEALSANPPDNVLIHDAARPFVNAEMITRIVEALAEHKAVMPVLQSVDTLREQTDSGWVDRPREKLFAVQTPQGFDFETIITAHRAEAGTQRTDDIAVLMAYNASIPAFAVTGDPLNKKITAPHDMLPSTQPYALPPVPKIGMGFDVHRLIPGTGAKPLRMGGIDIPHNAVLEGHSDADVVLHAITDALLGTIADADIGAHFSPNDARWKGADSSDFLMDAVKRVENKGGTITHVDVTVLCELPKISPHREAMRTRIAAITGLTMEQVSVKATTTEGLGFTGRKEGIAAQAVATVMFGAQKEAA